MPSGHFQHYAMYGGHWHFAPWIGPIALVAPLLVLAVLSIMVVGGQRAGRWCDARRSRSRATARPAAAWPCTTRASDTAAGATRPGDAVRKAAVLASDLDRDRVVDRLSQAVGDGHLSLEEGTERIDAALRSRHLRELEDLIADLPALQAASSTPAPHATHRRALAAGAALVVLAAFSVQLSTGIWALWPLAVAAVATASLVSRR